MKILSSLNNFQRCKKENFKKTTLDSWNFLFYVKSPKGKTRPDLSGSLC